MGDIRSSIADIAIHLAHDADMFILFSSQQIYSLLVFTPYRIQKAVFILALATWPVATDAGLVGLETGIGEDDDQALRVFIGGRDRIMLLCDQVGQRGWWRRLGSCHCDEDQLLCKELCWIILLQC